MTTGKALSFWRRIRWMTKRGVMSAPRTLFGSSASESRGASAPDHCSEREDLTVTRHGDFPRVVLADGVLPFGVGQISRRVMAQDHPLGVCRRGDLTDLLGRGVRADQIVRRKSVAVVGIVK